MSLSVHDFETVLKQYKDTAKDKHIVSAWLYIRCADGSYYTGSTSNLALRIAQHQAGGGCTYTRGRLPVELVFAQEFASEQEAFLRERQIKGWSRAKKEALIHDDFEALVELSKSGHEQKSA